MSPVAPSAPGGPRRRGLRRCGQLLCRVRGAAAAGAAAQEDAWSAAGARDGKVTLQSRKIKASFKCEAFFNIETQSWYFVWLCNFDRGLFLTLCPKLKWAFIF